MRPPHERRILTAAVLAGLVCGCLSMLFATTILAVTRPLRRFTPSTDALLWALAVLGLIDPVVTTPKVVDAAALGTVMRSS